MTLLLDTHLLLWIALAQRRVPQEATELLESGKHEPVFSMMNVWEIAIKYALGRADFQAEPRVLRAGFLRHGYRELAVTGEHALEAERLPALHRDPFDRMLVAQAQVEGMVLLTSDPAVGRYGGVVKLV